MYYLISLVWNWFLSTWLWKRHLKNILRFNLSSHFLQKKRKLISVHKQHGHPNSFLKAGSSFLSLFPLLGLTLWHDMLYRKRQRTVFTKIDEIRASVPEVNVLFIEPFQKRWVAEFLSHVIWLKWWLLKMLLTPCSLTSKYEQSAFATSQENSKWQRTEVWKSHGSF